MKTILLAALLPAFALTAHAELKLPAIIGDHMVLQQKQADPIWGWDTPGTKITVTYAGQTKSAEAGADGKWTVALDAGPASDKPGTISIQGTTQARHQRRAGGRGLDLLGPVEHGLPRSRATGMATSRPPLPSCRICA